MYKFGNTRRTSIIRNEAYEGETIEQKVRRIVNNKEPIKDGAPLVYTDRKDGVLPEYDIRTDKFEVAIEGMDKVAQQHLADRKKRFEQKLEDTNKSEGKEPGGEKTDPKVSENKGNEGSKGEGKA